MSSQTKLTRVRPDAKGRITLGKVTEGVSSYTVIIDDHKRIILEPFVEIPAHEQWLFDNKTALQQVKQGLKESAAGQTRHRSGFAKDTDKD
jgi:regulator of extracellular matrix RemA (YlzA/DUF370 family)